ncbi:MAG: M20/M25/M40 family metallo-hydrolase [Lewinellaceae bacterium]|nr:M20/M25/M40 family metallo-hydrolase [Lewinellaceae bacterium]
MTASTALLRYLLGFVLLILGSFPVAGQHDWDAAIQQVLPQTLKEHRAFVSLPNIPTNRADMQKNLDWATAAFKAQKFNVRLLESSTLPILFAERIVSKEAKTILFYLHIDGQPVNPANWDQADPFVPVLKRQNGQGAWEAIGWENLDRAIDPEWRIFGRAAADDKAPIMMMLTAVKLLDQEKTTLPYNIKIVLDPEEESSSHAFLSTLDQYKSVYAADYLIIMDGPAHPSNRPTLTFGCRGAATCSITVYGAKLPQHSGHYGNYAPNPVFALSHLLSSMKDEAGRVTIDGYYDGIQMTPEVLALMHSVPDDEGEIRAGLVIAQEEKVGEGYQESLQYPSLNVRHIETSWKGPGLKTIIPEVVTAHIDVRLVVETDGAKQLDKIRRHIQEQGYLVLDRDPTDEERLEYPKIAKFLGDPGVNAFRTEMDAPFGKILRSALEKEFGQPPVSIRTMGGTVPIIPAITTLGIPAIIVPMVNMDNNQHNPNENIRIGNMIEGIKMCMTILTMGI